MQKKGTGWTMTRKPVTCRVDGNVWKRLLIQAIQDGVAPGVLVESALVDYLEGRQGDASGPVTGSDSAPAEIRKGPRPGRKG